MSEIKRIKAFHESELDKILKDLELNEEFSRGELKCFICEDVITDKNIGCIFPYEDDIKICCNKLSCYEKVLDLRGG